jgi:hypothetical protein
MAGPMRTDEDACLLISPLNSPISASLRGGRRHIDFFVNLHVEFARNIVG